MIDVISSWKHLVIVLEEESAPLSQESPQVLFIPIVFVIDSKYLLSQLEELL
jgi:hypothetical protein